MEAGYDYLLLRGRLRRSLFRYAGIFFFVFGAVLLASGGAYYGYAAKAPNTKKTPISGTSSRTATHPLRLMLLPSSYSRSRWTRCSTP